MKRIRIVGLCLMALPMLGVLGAVGPASASAATPCEAGDSGNNWVFCSGGKDLIGKVEGTSGISKLESEVGGKAIVIECTTDTFSGSLEAEGATSGEVKFKGCKVVGVEKCTVHEPIEFKFKDQLIGKPPTAPQDEFKPAAGETFVEIKIEGASCAIKSTLKVVGTQTCKLPNFETEAEVHEIECTPAGSKLKLGEKEAKFTSTEKVKRVGGGVWSVRES